MNDTTAETAAGPIGPDTPNTPPPPSKPNHMERHMSRIEAVGVLMALAKKRSMNEDQVTALQMGAELMMAKHFQRHRSGYTPVSLYKKFGDPRETRQHIIDNISAAYGIL